jgi:hypothetical protein
MNGKIPKPVEVILAALAILAVSASVASAATTIYNNVPKPKPKNTSSVGFEARSTSEFGGAVGFAGAAPKRTNPSVTIVLSSWACQEGTGTGCKTTPGAKFAWPVTVKLYNVGAGGVVGSPIVESTKTLNIPYRPSANNKLCTPNEEGAVGYSKECFHGKETSFTFPLTGTIPNEVIISVSYNTSDYGATPQRPQPCNSTPAGCPYDSLNVGLEEETGATVGNQPRPEDTYVNSIWTGAYCDNGAAGTGTFRLDEGCWAGFQPLFTLKAS